MIEITQKYLTRICVQVQVKLYNSNVIIKLLTEE